MLFSKQDLKKLIGPLLLEQALAITVGMIDTMMVSSVGEAAISGVSLVDMINNLIFAVLSALATGGAVVTSQYLGGRQPAGCLPFLPAADRVGGGHHGGDCGGVPAAAPAHPAAVLRLH